MDANRRKDAKPGVLGTIENDNHADIWCFGPNFVLDYFTGQTCSVSGYNKKIQPNKICIGTGLIL